MRVHNRAPRWFVQSLFAVASAVALSGDGLKITISNDSAKDLLVTVYDMNTDPVAPVLSGQAIKGLATISISIVANGEGAGHLSWTAVTSNSDMRTCGHGDKSDLNNDDTVKVSAESDCGM
jgi:hypothetical protein